MQHAKSYGLEVRQEEVAEVEPGLDYHKVCLANSDLLHTYAVILATGGSPMCGTEKSWTNLPDDTEIMREYQDGGTREDFSRPRES